MDDSFVFSGVPHTAWQSDFAKAQSINWATASLSTPSSLEVRCDTVSDLKAPHSFLGGSFGPDGTDSPIGRSRSGRSHVSLVRSGDVQQSDDAIPTPG